MKHSSKLLSLLFVFFLFTMTLNASDDKDIPEEFISNDQYAEKAQTIVFPVFEEGKENNRGNLTTMIVMTGIRTSTWTVMLIDTKKTDAFMVGRLNVRNCKKTENSVTFSGKGINDINQESIAFSCSCNSKEFEFCFKDNDKKNQERRFKLTSTDENCPISVNENIALGGDMWNQPGWKLATLEQIYKCFQKNTQIND